MKYGFAHNQYRSSGTGNSHCFTVAIQDLSECDLSIFKKYFEKWQKINEKISAIEKDINHSVFKSKEEKERNVELRLLIKKIKIESDIVVGSELSDQNATFTKLIGNRYVQEKFSNMTIGDMYKLWSECKFIIPMINKNSI